MPYTEALQSVMYCICAGDGNSWALDNKVPTCLKRLKLIKTLAVTSSQRLPVRVMWDSGSWESFFCLENLHWWNLVVLRIKENDNRAWSSLSCFPLFHCVYRKGYTGEGYTGKVIASAMVPALLLAIYVTWLQVASLSYTQGPLSAQASLVAQW